MIERIRPDGPQPDVHPWQTLEVELRVETAGTNPYAEAIDVWIDLNGPGFSKRIYGFWNGGDAFLVRFAAVSTGTWEWRAGLDGDARLLAETGGSVRCVDWTESEKRENPLRRGFLKPSENGRLFVHDDGAPFFVLGDTWWATPTYRYPWDPDEPGFPGDDDSVPITPEPGMSFQRMVRYRRRQGFNCIAILAAFPHWANDGQPATLRLDDTYRTAVRQAWQTPGGRSAKDMHNAGGRAFEFPGRVPGLEAIVPDLDRLNPRYFDEMDRKITYLNEAGFVPFIEVARRDISEIWMRYHDWPESYARYIAYVFRRYHAHNVMLSPIHFDFAGFSIPARAYNAPANLVHDRWGMAPFGTPIGTNASPSTLTNFGRSDEARWLTFHQTGNWREHDHYWYLTEIFNDKPARPAFNGEPYYPGFPDDDPAAASEAAELNFRSGMYGSLLSGGLAGYIYGADGLWGGDVEPEARYRMWDALGFRSGAQVQHLRAFVAAAGDQHAQLIPDPELLTPNKSGPALGYRGWAFCARAAGRDLLLGYLEQSCPQVTVRGVYPDTVYTFRWFNPRTGAWIGDVRTEAVTTDQMGRAVLPDPPTPLDWGFKLERLRSASEALVTPERNKK